MVAVAVSVTVNVPVAVGVSDPPAPNRSVLVSDVRRYFRFGDGLARHFQDGIVKVNVIIRARLAHRRFHKYGDAGILGGGDDGVLAVSIVEEGGRRQTR